MTNLQVKNVDPTIHQALRERAAVEGRTISEYLLELIRRDLQRDTRREWLERAQTLRSTGRTSEENIEIRNLGRGHQ